MVVVVVIVALVVPMIATSTSTMIAHVLGVGFGCRGSVVAITIARSVYYFALPVYYFAFPGI